MSSDIRPSNDFTYDNHRDSIATAVSASVPDKPHGTSPKGESPSTTVLTLQEQGREDSDTTAIARALANAEKQIEPENPGCECKVSQKKKWSLLFVYSLAFFVDIWSYSALFIFTDHITADLKVDFAQQSWVITSYAATFAAFLLFWGRVSDLYSAKPVFVYGFLMLGVLDLIISFLPDKYSFFVLRAISGIAGACLIPAAFRLIVAVFEPHELAAAFTVYGMAGVIANTTGVVFAGIVQYIPNGGQMAAWRWFFRILAAMILPVALASWYAIPPPKGAIANADAKWKRLDLVGCFSMLSAIILIILGLTLGAAHGWKKAGFLAPFLLGWVLIFFFFYWETRLPAEYALLPPSTWLIPNFAAFIGLALYIYGWWATNFLPLIEIYQSVHHERAIISAVRLIPEGLSAAAVTVILGAFPVLTANPRWPITAGMLLGIVAYVLFSRGHQVGADYWKFVFTGGVLGSGGMMAVFTGTNVGVMTSVPPEMAGVAGAVLQVALQVGSAVALSVQAGLLTINEGGINNFSNVRASFYFEIGWGILWLGLFLLTYRAPKRAAGEKGAPVMMA